MELNTQRQESRVVSNGLDLDVHSVFYTIQGEGPFAGVPAVFVRLAGCNLQCPFCDTEYTSGRKVMNATALSILVAAECVSNNCNLVVITGGEPFRQNITQLCADLVVEEGLTVQVETNGTLPIQDYNVFKDLVDILGMHIVCSPKTGRVHDNVATLAGSWKYVVSHRSVDPTDGLPIMALANELGRHSLRIARPDPEFAGDVFIQPMDEQDADANRLHMHAAVNSVMNNPNKAHWNRRLCVQMHKLAELE